jgi:hypothetical protein
MSHDRRNHLIMAVITATAAVAAGSVGAWMICAAFAGATIGYTVAAMRGDRR